MVQVRQRVVGDIHFLATLLLATQRNLAESMGVWAGEGFEEDDP